MSECSIKVSGLWKRYDIHPIHSLWGRGARLARRVLGREEAGPDFWALQDIDFEVKRGETLGIIGPNGAGKSTLLKILCGVTTATRGRAEVRGRVAPLIELGAGFHPELSGRENVLINGVMLGMSLKQVRKKYDEIVEFSGLGEFMDTPVKKYSSGMFVRLGFSVAVHTDPEILLIDEVLAVGDLAFKHKCVERLRELRRGGVTALFVSHNMHQVSLLCERALFLERGRVRCVGSTDAVLEAYMLGEDDVDAAGKPIRMLEGESGVEIATLELTGADGQPTTRAKCGERLTTKFTVRTSRPLKDPVLSHVLMRDDGLRVAVSRTISDWPAPLRIEGTETFELRIDTLKVRNGRYHVELVIHDAAMALLARVRSREFVVTGGPVMDTGRFGGVFYHDVLWQRSG